MKVRPCPFCGATCFVKKRGPVWCGGVSKPVTFYSVRCNNDRCCVLPHVAEDTSARLVVAAWNRRTPEPTALLISTRFTQGISWPRKTLVGYRVIGPDGIEAGVLTKQAARKLCADNLWKAKVV